MISARDDKENPYSKLAAFALGNHALRDTLVSIATEWMYNYGRSNAVIASARQTKALTAILKVLESLELTNSNPTDHVDPGSIDAVRTLQESAVSAILMQIAHVAFSGSTGAEAHLLFSYHLLNKLGYISQSELSFFPRLLVQRFAMADVAAALLHSARPHAPLTFTVYQVNEDLDFTQPSFRGMTGCPQPVLSALARIAHLACDLREGKQRADAICRKAEALEDDLRAWSSQKSPDMFCLNSETSSSSLQYVAARDLPSFGTALNYHLALLNECFDWLAHLLLQRRLYCDRRDSPRVQQTVKRVLLLLEEIPPHESPASSLPLPLYLVARECICAEDRDSIRDRHRLCKEVYRSSTREHLMTMTEEIWSNEDRRRAAGRGGRPQEDDQCNDELVVRRNTLVMF